MIAHAYERYVHVSVIGMVMHRHYLEPEHICFRFSPSEQHIVLTHMDIHSLNKWRHGLKYLICNAFTNCRWRRCRHNTTNEKKRFFEKREISSD